MKDRVETATAGVRDLGAYIREQRRGSDVSLRQLAALAGVSNPYLSQIERGLRKPSATVLQQIAKALRISAEVLYVQAGILEEREGGAVADAVLADERLSERQKQVLLEIYDSFLRESPVPEPADRPDRPDRPDAQPRVDPTDPPAGSPAAGPEPDPAQEATP